jgi:hypothetical protein
MREMQRVHEVPQRLFERMKAVEIDDIELSARAALEINVTRHRIKFGGPIFLRREVEKEVRIDSHLMFYVDIEERGAVEYANLEVASGAGEAPDTIDSVGSHVTLDV